MNTAKVFMTGGCQAVRIPKKYHLNVDEVYINYLGHKLILTPKKSNTWTDLYHELENIPKGEEIGKIEDFPPEEREWSCFE